jgi:hypothetical protein
MCCHNPSQQTWMPAKTLHSSTNTPHPTTHIPVLHVYKAALLQQQADRAHVAADSRQMQRGTPLSIEYICVMLRVLQQVIGNSNGDAECSVSSQAGGWSTLGMVADLFSDV